MSIYHALQHVMIIHTFDLLMRVTNKHEYQ